MGRLKEPNPSLWVETTREAAAKPLSGDVTADVAVIGAGIAGITTALELALVGVKVVVIDAGRVSSGVTGYTTAKITALHGLKYAQMLKTFGEDRTAMYAAANSAALERYAALVAEHKIDCDFRRMAAYTYTERDEYVSQIEAEVRACETVGLKATLTSETALPYPVKAAAALDDQALFHPRKFVLAAAKIIIAKGGQVFENTRATDVKETARQCVVETEHGKVHTKHVVIATHLPFPGQGEFYAKTEPSRSYALALSTDGEVPDGMYISAETPVRSIRPHFLGKETYLIVGGEGHRVGDEDDTTKRYETLQTWSRERFGLKDVAYQWSAQDYMPADGLPFIGPIDATSERVFVATGFGKWGITNGMAAATIISDRILGRDNAWAMAFDSTRKPSHTAMAEVSQRTDEASKAAESKVDTSLKGMKKGEGRVVELAGQQVAVYRDDKGAMHAVDAACSHMGCTVAWNTAELSWDCPCHGSRFDVDGVAIQAPATKDLPKKNLTSLSAWDAA